MCVAMQMMLIVVITALGVTATGRTSSSTSTSVRRNGHLQWPAQGSLIRDQILGRLRAKRLVNEGRRRSKACQLLIAIDEPLFKVYNQDVDNVTATVTDFVRELNSIYGRTLFAQPGPFENLYFHVKEIRILFDFCQDCNETQNVYLSQFSQLKTSSFCLAHVLTFRDFPSGVQGLAWKSTVCRRRQNTGFSSLINHQVPSSREESIMTLAHEIGHNFGAQHDEDAGCGSGYIMSQTGSKREHNRDHEFSPCSLRDMTNNLTFVLSSSLTDCFQLRVEDDVEDFSFCGNHLVEGEEECDCGMDYHHCQDPCCYAARINPADRALNASAIPCRRHQKAECLRPLQSIFTSAIVAPWSFILITSLISFLLLLWDWKRDRLCFTHVTKPKELIRAETTEQMTHRIKRQQSHQPFRNVFRFKSPAAIPQVHQRAHGNTDPSAPPSAP